MLDSPSISATASRPAAHVPADRAADRQASPSAFTTFVDALTGQEPAGRSASTTGDRDDADRPADDAEADRDQSDACAVATTAQAAEAVPPKAIAIALALAASRGGARTDSTGPFDIAEDAAVVKMIAQRIAALRAQLAAATAAGADAAQAAVVTTDAAPDPADGADDIITSALSRAALTAAFAAQLGRSAGDAGAKTSDDGAANTSGKDGAETPPASPSAAIASALRLLADESGHSASKIAQAVEASLAAAVGPNGSHMDAAALRVFAATLPATTLISGANAHGLLSTDAGAAVSHGTLPGTDTGLQIIQAMRLQWSRGVGEAHINLEPNQFGDASISLRVEQGQVLAKIQADVPMVREWLQSNQGWLRQSLADQGLTLHKLEITEPPAKSGHEDRRQSSREGRDQRPARRQRHLLPGEVFEVVA